MTATVDVLTLTATPGVLARACTADQRWLWLLAPGMRPRPGALDLLTAAIEPRGASRAAIVAGVVVDAEGTPVAGELPAGDPRDADAVIRLARACVLPIRSTTFAHCLVDRAAIVTHGPPDDAAYGPHAAREWSARVLRESPGYLAAASVAVLERRERAQTPLQALRGLPPTLRTIRTGTWTRGESAHALVDLARATLGRS